MTEKVTTQGLIARCGLASSGLIRADYFRVACALTMKQQEVTTL